MKKLAFYFLFLSSLIIGGCSNNEHSKTETSHTTNSTEIEYPVSFALIPDNFTAYYDKKSLDVKLSENNAIETILPKNIQEHQSEIYFEAELPLLNKTVVDWNHNNISFKANSNELSNLYIEKIEQFFKAGQNKDFNQINNYTDNFYNETKDNINDSTFISEDIDKMSLKKIYGYDQLFNLQLIEGQLSFVLAGYFDYDYHPDYLDAPLEHKNQPLNFTFIFDSTKNKWLLDKMNTFNGSLDGLPKPEDNDASFVTKEF